MRSGKILFGALAGLAVGIQIGILIAPEKGKDTRKKLGKLGEDYLDEMNSSFNKFLDGMSEKIDKINKNVIAVAEEGKSKSTNLVNQAKDKIK